MEVGQFGGLTLARSRFVQAAAHHQMHRLPHADVRRAPSATASADRAAGHRRLLDLGAG